jgi:acetyltransferase-like isoleucine patch superfamily enzyme
LVSRQEKLNKKKKKTLFEKILKYPHSDIHRGELRVDLSIPSEAARFSRRCIIDLTGSVTIGKWCWIGHGTKIYTHQHYFNSTIPLRLLKEQVGVDWKDKVIGQDVWLYGCVVLMDVTEIPDGVVVGIGSILTQNPGPYEIWAGNPAKKIGSRIKEAT